MATKEEAIHRVVGLGFSNRAASAIVEDLGPKAVFDGMPERDNAGSAIKFVTAHGYSKDAAQSIVERTGAHIINTAALLSTHTPEEEKHPLWDFPTEGGKKKKGKEAEAAA